MPSRSSISLIQLCVVCAALSTSAQTPGVVNTPVIDVVPQSGGLVLTRSEFARLGKDPFFPKSTRGAPAIRPADVPEPVVTFNDLSLKGIGRGVCIINNRTFAIGEEAMMKIKGAQRRIKLVKILSENRVLVEVNGVTQELNLNQR